MNKTLAILFLAILLVLTQNKVTSYANASSTNSPTTVISNTTHIDDDLDTKDKMSESNIKHENDEDEIEKSHINKVHENEDDDEDEGGNRRISIIPGSTPSGGLKYKLSEHALPKATPSPKLTQVLGATTQTTDATVTPTPTTIPNVNSENEKLNESFDLIKEIEKLLSSLQKIIFSTIS